VSSEHWQITPQRPHCVAEDPVLIEPVSAAIFPANREINRESCEIWHFHMILTSSQRVISIASSRIP
jgi:hypothetical protein